jgi:hypothetical protein
MPPPSANRPIADVERSPPQCRQWPMKQRSTSRIEWPLPGDTVEKVAARRFHTAGEKIDLSDGPTNRSRTSVEGKRTPKNLARKRSATFSTASRYYGRSLFQGGQQSRAQSGPSAILTDILDLTGAFDCAEELQPDQRALPPRREPNSLFEGSEPRQRFRHRRVGNVFWNPHVVFRVQRR